MLKSSKLFAVWQLLSRIEQRELERWLAYDTVRDDVNRLYALLVAARENGQDYDKNQVFEHLYADAPYNDNRLRHAFSFLTKHIERFLVQHTTAENTVLAQGLLAATYRQHKYEEGFEQTFRTWQQTLAAAPQNAETLQQHAVAELEWLRYQTKNRPEKNNLQTLLDAEEKAFAAHKLRTVCTALSYQNVHKTQFDFGVLAELLARIEAQNWQDTEPAIGAYYFIYKMTTETESEPFFLRFRAKMVAYTVIFTTQERYDCYIFAINYVIKQANKGNSAYFRTLFELYKEGIEQRILLADDGTLSPMTFRNAVNTGLRVGETAYIFVFLEKYNALLPRKVRRNYHQHALGRYYFAVGDYDNAKTILLNLVYNQWDLQLDGKVILMKIFYETDDFEQLDTHLNSFRQLLHRKRNALGYHQANYKNIIDLAKKLMTINFFDKKAVAALREEIETTNPNTEKEWLLAQL
jgi:hypothetical protein